MPEIRKLTELKQHPAQAGIYGSEAVDADLVRSIKENGIMQPLVIMHDGTILAGHRRWRAAMKAGLPDVPVEIKRGLSALEQEAFIIESNYQRQKTERQLAREAMRLKEIEAERAKLRQAATQFKSPHGAAQKSLTAKSAKNAGRTMEAVGSRLGMSRAKVEKLVAVEEKIEQLEGAGLVDEAKHLEKTLEKKSVDAAFKVVKPPPIRPASPPPSAIRPVSVIAKGKQVSQNYLRSEVRRLGAEAVTSTSNLTDSNAHGLIGKLIKESSARVVAQAIAILIEEWPADGAAFLVGTVNYLKSGNGKDKTAAGLQAIEGWAEKRRASREV